MAITFTNCSHVFTGLHDDAKAETITFKPLGKTYSTDTTTDAITFTCDGVNLAGGAYSGDYVPGASRNIKDITVNWGDPTGGGKTGKSISCWSTDKQVPLVTWYSGA